MVETVRCVNERKKANRKLPKAYVTDLSTYYTQYRTKIKHKNNNNNEEEEGVRARRESKTRHAYTSSAARLHCSKETERRASDRPRLLQYTLHVYTHAHTRAPLHRNALAQTENGNTRLGRRVSPQIWKKIENIITIGTHRTNIYRFNGE